VGPGKLSVHELPPLESGGVIARKGFNFQDHRAAGYCLEMVSTQHLSQVWCEAQDDITLIWLIDGLEEVEFVQVKSNELNQLWSLAKLYARKDGKPGTSILERSFAYDRCVEPCCFRIVTAYPVNAELDGLKLPLNHPHRLAKFDVLRQLSDKLDAHLPGYTSPNGNTLPFWVAKVRWEVVDSESSLRVKNLLSLDRLLDAKGVYVLTSQQESMYEDLLSWVKDAAAADPLLDLGAKKITQAEMINWLDERIVRATTVPSAVVGGKTLRAKMVKAGLSVEVVEGAREQRMHYMTEVLHPKFLDTSKRTLVEMEVAARRRCHINVSEADEVGNQASFLT